MWENLTRFIHVNRNLSRLLSYFSSVFRLLGVWQWRIQGKGPKGSKKKSCSSISTKYIDFLEPIVISCDFFNWLLETHVSSNHRNV